MPPTRSRAIGLAVATSLALVAGSTTIPVVAADSPEGAVNDLIDAVERGEYDAIDALVCEAEREAVREMLDPSASMGLSADDFPITLKFDDRALEVISEDGDEVTIRLTGEMSMDVPEDEIEALAMSLLEADMGDELSEEDIELMLPFMTMAFTQTAPMDEELTVVNEGGEWLVCGGLGEAPADDYEFEDDFGLFDEDPAEGLCGLATAEELSAAGSIEYASGSGWELTTCTYQDSDYTLGTTVTVELDADAAYAADAYGYDQELQVAGAAAFTSDQPGSPLLVQVGPDTLSVQVGVWVPDSQPEGFDPLRESTAVAELFAPRLAESRDQLVAPVLPLLCDLGFATELEASMGLPMHYGSVSDQSCNFESRENFVVNAYVSQGTIEQYRGFYAESEDTTFAGQPALELADDLDESAYNIIVELPGEQLLTVDVRPSAYDKPMSVSGSEVVEALTQHIVDKSTE